MRKLLLFFTIASCLSAQAVRFDPQSAGTVASNVPPGAFPPVLAVPGAVVSLYTYPSMGTGVAYTDYTAATACPVGSPVVLPGTTLCTNKTDSIGRFGFWLASGNYAYTVTFPNGASYGPFPFSVGGSGGSGGGVSSVGLALPVDTFSITGSPVTTAGVLTGSFLSQAQNTAHRGPCAGGIGAVTWRVDCLGDEVAFVAAGPGHSGGYVPDPGNAAHTPPYLLGDNGVFQILSGCSYTGNTFTCGGGGGGGSGFDQITSGSNTSATMTVSTGATMGVTGTGIITASGFNELAASTSSTTLSIGPSCSNANPCNVRIGNTAYSVVNTASVPLTGGTGTAFVYMTQAGVLTVGYNGITLGSCTVCTAASGVTSIPVTAVPIASVVATSGAWGAVTDLRSPYGRDVIIASTGLLGSTTAGVQTLSIDPSVVVTFSSGVLVNPMNTLGDIIYGGVSGAPTRLGGSTIAGAQAVLISQASGGGVAQAPFFSIAPAIGVTNMFYCAPGTGGGCATMQAQITATAINGIDYGMKCDGTTDDAAALQNAVNALSVSTTSGPGRLQLPAGNCILGTGVASGTSNIEIFSNGLSGTVLTAKAGSALPYILSFTGSNVNLHDFGLDGNMANYGLGLNTTLYNNSATYYPSGSVSARGDGGGPDTVAVVSGSTVTVYKCILTANGHTPPNATYWTQIDTFTSAAQAAYISGGGASGFLIKYSNANHLKMDHLDLKGGEFGVFIYAISAPVADIQLTNSYCHDFNVQQDLGNNATMDCIHGFTSGGNTIRDVDISHNRFINIYVPVTGPASTSAGFIDASALTFSDNKINQVLNRGGGASVVPGINNVEWTITGNTMIKTASLNGDETDGIEVEESESAFTGNAIYGFDQCMSMTNYSPHNVGVNTFTGNVCLGTGAGNGLVIEDSGTGQSFDTTVTGNTFYNYVYGIWISPVGGGSPALPVNVSNQGNTFQSMGTAPLFDPDNATGWIWTNYTPTITLTAGGYTPNVGTTGAQYKLDGKTAAVQVTARGSITGTYTSATLTVLMPFNAVLDQYIPVQVAAPSCTAVSTPQGYIVGGTNVISVLFNAVCSGSQTVSIFASGTYQTQ